MTDLPTLVTRVLHELRADRFLAPGARVRDAVDSAAREQGLDLRQTLAQAGQRFSDFLEGLPGIVLVRRPGTDVLVGLPGAVPPPPKPRHASSPRFRKDIFEAFTRIAERNFWYLPSRDLFSLDPAGEDQAIPVPPVTLDSLIAERREFASTRPTEEERILTVALELDPSPLAAFQRTTGRLRITQTWLAFKLTRLQERIAEWARQHTIDFSASWYASDLDEEREYTPQEILAAMAQHMTLSEVRGLKVPFRAVEALIRSALTRRKLD